MNPPVNHEKGNVALSVLDGLHHVITCCLIGTFFANRGKAAMDVNCSFTRINRNGDKGKQKQVEGDLAQLSATLLTFTFLSRNPLPQLQRREHQHRQGHAPQDRGVGARVLSSRRRGG